MLISELQAQLEEVYLQHGDREILVEDNYGQWTPIFGVKSFDCKEGGVFYLIEGE